MTYTYFRRGKCLYWSTDPDVVSAAHRRAETMEQAKALMRLGQSKAQPPIQPG